MPSTPFVLNGIITDLDTNVLEGCNIVAKNETNGGNTATITNANGEYVLDLANTGTWNLGDTIKVKIYKQDKAKIETFDITQVMIDNGGNELDIEIFGLAVYTYNTMFDLVNANAPLNYTDKRGTEQEWTITSAMPEVNADYPAVVIKPSGILTNPINFDNSVDEQRVSIEIEFLSKAADGKQRIDIGRDFNRNVFKNNLSDLQFANFYPVKNDFIDESNIGEVFIGGEKYNIANQIFTFKYSK